MSRYTGPRVKKMRALGIELPGLSAKSIERRPYPPGQHGLSRRRKRSDFGLRLIEKQKLRFNYGVSEAQMRRLMKECLSSKHSTGDHLITLLERRLDNVIFRSGFATTTPAARQLVNHRHLRVNGRNCDIASFRVSIGDVITFGPRSQELSIVTESLDKPTQYRPEWLDVDTEQRRVHVKAYPDGSSAPFPIDTQLVVEYYSRVL